MPIPPETIANAAIVVDQAIVNNQANDPILTKLLLLKLMLVYGLTEEEAAGLLAELVALGMVGWTSVQAIASLVNSE